MFERATMLGIEIFIRTARNHTIYGTSYPTPEQIEKYRLENSKPLFGLHNPAIKQVEAADESTQQQPNDNGDSKS